MRFGTVRPKFDSWYPDMYLQDMIECRNKGRVNPIGDGTSLEKKRGESPWGFNSLTLRRTQIAQRKKQMFQKHFSFGSNPNLRIRRWRNGRRGRLKIDMLQVRILLGGYHRLWWNWQTQLA